MWDRDDLMFCYQIVFQKINKKDDEIYAQRIRHYFKTEKEVFYLPLIFSLMINADYKNEMNIYT